MKVAGSLLFLFVLAGLENVIGGPRDAGHDLTPGRAASPDDLSPRAIG